MFIIDNYTIMEDTGFLYTIEADELDIFNIDITVMSFEMQN